MGFQNTIVATNLPSFPWVPGDKLDAVPLNNAVIGLQEQITNLVSQVQHLESLTNTTALGVTLGASWGGNTTPLAGPYILVASAPYDFTITDALVNVGTNGGSFDVQFLNNGSPIVGLESVTVSSPTQVDVLATDNVTVTQGSQVTMVVSNVQGTPQNSWATVNGSTRGKPPKSQGITTGSAQGISIATATGASFFSNAAFGNAVGASTAHAVGITAIRGVAAAVGTSAADMHGQSLTLGSRVATATGTSTATAVGSNGFPTLVMDDPTTGVLDQNPLG